MKNLVPWIKSNLIIVIAMAVAIIALPVAIFFSFTWNASIKKVVGDDVSAAVNKLQALKVDYSLPSVVPGQPGFSVPKTEPNEAYTTAFLERLKAISSESDEVRKLAEDRNKAGKTLLVEGLFPQPADESARVRKLTDMRDAYEPARNKLLTEAGAGMPPPPEEIAVKLQTKSEQEVRSKTGGRVDQNLSDDEKRDIQKVLSATRLELYQTGAAAVAFYASPEVFGVLAKPQNSGPGGGGLPGAPSSSSPPLPTLEQAWEWQSAHWVYQDIIAAIVKANRSPSGQRVAAYEAPVKRLEALAAIEMFGSSPTPADSSGGRDGPGAPGAEGASPEAVAPAAGGGEGSEVPKDYTVSHTGRPVHTGLFDLRYAEMIIICDSARLPKIINAINTTNFMNVVDLKIQAIDPTIDLSQGFFYGNDHLVRVKMRVETAWMRSWIKQYMPKSIRAKLGIPDDAPPPTGTDPNAPADGKPQA